jgi:hypothetical protein
MKEVLHYRWRSTRQEGTHHMAAETPVIPPAATPRKIRIEAVGWLPAVEASDLRVGDQLMYNFGGVAQVTKIETASPQFLRITEQSVTSGRQSTRRVKKTSLMARLPQGSRRRLGHDAPAAHYRAQVQAPGGGNGWVTVSHGRTLDAAVNGSMANNQPSHFGSLVMDRHGFDRADGVRAMAEGETLTAENGHRFRVLPPGMPTG